MKIIGISGISGSGKSRLTTFLQEEFKENAITIHQDNYYNDQTKIDFEDREKVNYDEPSSLEFELLEKNLLDLLKGKEIKMPQYNFEKHTRFKDYKLLKPKDIIFVEGTLLFSQPNITKLFNCSIYVDTPLDIAIIRRMTRDIKERGRSPISIQEQYLNTVRDGMLNYCIPYKNNSTYLLSGENDVLNYKEFIINEIKNIK